MKRKKDIYGEYPQVVYENGIVKRNVLSYLKYLECPSFRIILKDMGFTKDDTVYLYRDILDREVLYSVNEKIVDFDNKMRFDCGLLFECPPYIVVKNKNEVIKYHCVRSTFQKDDIWFDKDCYVKKYSDNKEFTRNYSKYGYYSSIVKDEYKLNVSLYDMVDVYDNVDIVIEKEKALEEYLVGLEFPVKIDEVYRKICEIIGQEIDKYLTIKIEVSKKIDINNNSRKYNITDIIEISNGKVIKFGITFDNKIIFVDDNNNWSYKITKDDGRTVSYSISVVNGNLDYSVNDSDNKDFEILFSRNLNEARSGLEKVKTRVRSMLKK